MRFSTTIACLIFLVPVIESGKAQESKEKLHPNTDSEKVEKLAALNQQAVDAIRDFDFIFSSEPSSETSQYVKLRWRKTNGFERIDSVTEMSGGPLENIVQVYGINHQDQTVSMFSRHNADNIDKESMSLLPDEVSFRKKYEAWITPYDPRLGQLNYAIDPLLLRFSYLATDDQRTMIELVQDSSGYKLKGTRELPEIEFIHPGVEGKHKGETITITLNSKENYLCAKVEVICVSEQWYRTLTVEEFAETNKFKYPAHTKIEFGVFEGDDRKPHSIRHCTMKPFSADRLTNAEFRFPTNTMVKELESPIRLGGAGLQRNCDVLV